MAQQHDPEGRRLPIKLDTTTNGEFAPIPLEPVHHQARRLASDLSTENAKRRGVSRRFFLVSACALAAEPGKRSYLQCLNSDEFIKDVFMDSDTDMMVLSFVPSRRAAEPLTIEEAAATAEIVERMEGTHRLLVHGRVNPIRTATCRAWPSDGTFLPGRLTPSGGRTAKDIF